MDKNTLLTKLNSLLQEASTPQHFFRQVTKDNSLILAIEKYTEHLSNTELPEQAYSVLHNDEGRNCLICGAPTKFISLKDGYKKYCAKCVRKTPESIAKREATTLARHGVRNISELTSTKELLREKAKERYADPIKKKDFLEKEEATCLAKYNVKNSAQVPEFKEKSKQTNINKYGEDHFLKTEDGKTKLKQSNLEKYNAEFPMQNKEVKAKQQQTVMEIHNVKNTFQLPKSIENKKKVCIELFGGESPMCSPRVQEKAKQTNNRLYRSDHYLNSEQYKRDMLDQFGYDNPFKSPIVQDGIKFNNIDNYGAPYPMQNKEVQARAKATNLKNWGFENPASHPEVKEKSLRRNWEKTYSFYMTSEKLRAIVTPMCKLEDYRGSDKLYPFKCTTCKKIFDSYFGGYINGGSLPRCPICKPITVGVSQYEQEIVLWLKSLGITNIIEGNRKIIKPYELDIFLPDYNLAIEFNGLAYHSEKGIHDGKKVPRIPRARYHAHKTKLCEERGITLIHIYDDEWLDKKIVIQSIIKNKLGIVARKIGARQCEVRIISASDCYNFLFENHLNGAFVRRYNFGLFYKDELMYVLSLGEARQNNKYQFEVIRSCCELNTNVQGGFSKLISYAVKTLNIQSMISYVDKRYFNGNGYKNNWKFVRQSAPTFNYVSPNYTKRYNREHFQKHKLKDLFPELYDEKLTEWQIMQLAGYDRIWDCGNLIYEYIACKQ